MSSSRSFAGRTFYRPGARSRSQVDQSGGAPLGSNGTMFIVAESDKGAPGDVSGIRSFTSSEISNLITEYGSGQIVDQVLASRTPGFLFQNVNGPDEYLVWKTNSSTQASLALQNGDPATLMTLTDKNWGTEGNKITAEVANGTVPATQRVLTFRKSGKVETMSENPASIQMALQYIGAGTAASALIAGTLTAKQFTTTVTGGPGSEDLNIDLEAFSLKELVDFINNFGGGSVYTCTTASSVATVTPANDLDPVTEADVKTSATDFYRLQEELLDIIADESVLVDAKLSLDEGLPVVLAETPLSGGAKGASASSDFTAGFDKSLTADYNDVVPGISRDASEDITDGRTDAASTYDIETVIAALRTHLNLRGDLENRKEAQAMVGYRKAAKADVYTQAQTTGSEVIQLWLDDVLVVNQASEQEWQHPHIAASIAAGIRLGTEVGEPLTHKFMNILGVGHVVNPTTGLSTGDFEEAIDGKSAIKAGVSFLEQVSGGFRVVVDNTTYGADQNFVFNRGSVVEASHFIAKDIRDNLETAFIGKKVSAGIAESMKSFIRQRLQLLLDDRILSSSPGKNAPLGYDNDTFTIVITGNSAVVRLKVIPVQGLDFIFIDFTLDDILQSA